MELLALLSQNFQFVFSDVMEHPGMKWLIVGVVTIDVAAKSVALWRAARMGMVSWFVVLFLLNTVGILPMIFMLMTNKTYLPYKYSPDSHNSAPTH